MDAMALTADAHPAAHLITHPAADPGADATTPPAGRWQRLLAALRRAVTGRQPGLPPLRAAFSREFIWPLRPGQVARWAQRHGWPQPLAPADWPRRRIDSDRARLAALRQKGLAHDLPLHVLTAAIGVGDRRICVRGDIIVAINTDPNAPIFEFAHYGIVGNAMQVLPVLTEAFRTHLDKRIRKVA